MTLQVSTRIQTSNFEIDEWIKSRAINKIMLIFEIQMNKSIYQNTPWIFGILKMGWYSLMGGNVILFGRRNHNHWKKSAMI